MRATVLKPFRYSTDGIRGVQLDAGDERDFADDMAPGLVREGWIAEVTPEPEPVATAPVPAAPALDQKTDQPAPASAQSKRGRR